ncbi:hydrolase [Streptomyces abyssalis]|uniref:Hydrolase n=1 Tax=Streptomyces abyssalis TaxID=933944 RepID=A0A1E7JRB6_9ACTN|nr:HAD family hydrolase [Streptomyces abyssalis]OEU90774.1 hydrolase [Streptomyces abyssalis]OEU95392.1 hydrolase [Streptomyces abyssalis]
MTRAPSHGTGDGGSFPYRLIATDLDGTLLRDDETVSARTRAALAAASARGVAHIAVTGRSVPWTKDILAGLDYKGLAVCGQGAQVYDAGAGRVLTSVTLDRRLAQLAVSKIEAETGATLLLAASQDGIDGEVLVGPGYRDQGKGLPAVVCADRDELWAAPLNKLYLQHTDLGTDELAKAARTVTGDLVSITVSGEDLVEMLPLGLSKAKGLSIAARRLGVSARETIAFGDMPNDIPMLAWAAHGVAMADAHPELLAVADEITGSNNADGIAVVLERLLSE